MDSFTNQQLSMVIKELDQAIENHDRWYKNLQRVLITHIAPEQSDLMPNAHQLCHFGQWYSSTKAAFLQQYPNFISLGDAHKKMHEGARHLIQNIMAGATISVHDWDKFDADLEKMRFEMKMLRDKFIYIAHSRDPLTEAQTRANLLAELHEQHALVQRGKQVCAIAMLDLDHFKHVNDVYGHAAGDEVLVGTVHCLKSYLRPYDRIFRYGGEEFIICMPSTCLAQAVDVVERMRTIISKQHFKFANYQVTASFGVTMLVSTQTVEESLARVDQAMYQAKTTGRNRVVFDGDE